MTKEKKENRGGYRENAGRKKGTKTAEPTEVIRVPKALIAEIKKMVKKRKKALVSKKDEGQTKP